LARQLEPGPVSDLEVNPFVVSGDRLVALDALVTLGNDRPDLPAPRPVARIRCLLKPESVAVVGVSQAMNPGRIIVENLKKLGYPAAGITILKEGTDELAGCRCVPSLTALEKPVDLLVCSISADQVPALVEEAAVTGKARSLVLIPGGMEEKAGASPALKRMHAALADSRKTADGGPVLNGANCVGFRSLPGRVDTLFIPDHKLPAPVLPGSPIALVSQSGAFLVAALDRLGPLSPRYSLSIGNQTDLTAADYLEYLADEPDLELVAVYMEGFKAGDGSRFIECVQRIRESGCRVLLYVAGRTPAGAMASASHTASVAGDHFVIQTLARQAGATVTDSITEFGDLIRLHAQLAGRPRLGGALGAVSNAGFECVAIADNLGDLSLARFGVDTETRLQELLVKARVDRIVDLHNPLDLTPMAGDTVFGEVVEALAAAPEVQALVVGCVPMTPALTTLPAGPGHGENLAADEAVAERLARVFHNCGKAMLVAVEGGEGYHALRRHLMERGVPVTGSVENATRLLALWHQGS
jgi:acyl-CoA synthetase (NDP forming)